MRPGFGPRWNRLADSTIIMSRWMRPEPIGFHPPRSDMSCLAITLAQAIGGMNPLCRGLLIALRITLLSDSMALVAWMIRRMSSGQSNLVITCSQCRNH